MALSSCDSWMLILYFIASFAVTGANSDVACNETYYLEIGKPAIVSCEYERSFYAVRWYIAGQEIPILRLDGNTRGGSGLTSGDFNITSDGSMVIADVKLKHENNYTISVLDSSVNVISQQVKVHVSVSLENLHVGNCKSSENEVCNRLELRQKRNALFCIAKNSRPPVDITWKTMYIENQNQILTPLDSDVVFNTTSLLYTTLSLVLYHEEYFGVEYVTCVVAGKAVGKYDNVSLFLISKRKFLQSTSDVQYVNRGSLFQLECPSNTFVFGILKYHYPNGTTKSLKTFHKHNKNECDIGTDCKQDGLFTIEEVSVDDEGSYECTFGNDTVSYNHISNLTIVVVPEKTMTIIENCEEKQECTQNVVFRGVLKCFVIGLRPSVDLSYEVAEYSKGDIWIFNIKTQVMYSSDGFSFDTLLTAEYDIQECSEPVQVTCKAESKVHNGITSSKVLLVTDNRNCTDPNTRLVMVLIIVSVVIVLVLALAVFIWRKYGTRQQNSLDVHESQSLRLRNTETSEVKGEKLREDLKIDGKSYTEDERAKKGRKALQEKFDNKILPLIEDIKSGKITKDEFITILTEFNTEHKVDPLIYMEGFLTGERLETEELLIVIKYIGGSVPNKWISVEDYSHLMKVFVTSKKPPVDGFLELLKESYQKDLINLPAYANITESFLTKQDEDFDQFFVAMKEVIKDNKYAKSELVNVILEYYVISAISQHTILKYVGYLGLPNKIAYPHFLQVLVYHIKGSKTETKLQELFNIIVKKAMLEKKAPPDHKAGLQEQDEVKFKKKILDNLSSSHKEDLKNKLSSIFLQVLLYSIEKKTIKVTECLDILTEEIDENRILKSEYQKAVDLSLQENWLSLEKSIDILQASLEKTLLRFKDFIEILERNLQNKLISEHSFEEQFRYYLKLDKWNKENWIRLVYRLWQKKIIGDALKSTLLSLTIDKYQMAKTDMKLILDKSGVEPDKRKDFMKDIEFPGLIERAKQVI